MPDYTDWILILIRERWSTRTGLVIALVLVGGSLAAFFAQVDLAAVSVREWLFITAVLGCIAFGWWRTRLPRTRKGKVGFGIAIQFEDADSAKQLKNDLVGTMGQLLSGSRFRRDFQFIEFSQSVARR